MLFLISYSVAIPPTKNGKTRLLQSGLYHFENVLLEMPTADRRTSILSSLSDKRRESWPKKAPADRPIELMWQSTFYRIHILHLYPNLVNEIKKLFLINNHTTTQFQNTLNRLNSVHVWSKTKATYNWEIRIIYVSKTQTVTYNKDCI